MSPRATRLFKTALLAVLIGFAIVGVVFLVTPYLEKKPIEKDTQLSSAPDSSSPLIPREINLLTGQTLLDELRKGGLVIFMRHFHSDHRKFHEDPIKKDHLTMTLEDFKSSGEKQRHLSEYGRYRARLIHDALRHFQVPIGQVISSPYIRAVEGATLMTGREPDTITKDLLHRGGDYTSSMMNANILPFLTTPVTGTSNTILMSHRPPMDEIHYIEEGQMFVFRPTGDGAFDMIGGIHDTDWIEAQVSIEFLGKRYAEFTVNESDQNVAK